MDIKFVKKYLSIESFDPIELPNFSIITGVNGSGKSHLLKAIENGDVQIQGFDKNDIVLFNYENFRLDNESAFTGQQISAEKESAWQYYEANVKANALSWRNNIGENYSEIKNECIEKNKSMWSFVSEPLKSYKTNFKNWYKNPKIKQNQQAQGVFSLAKKLPYSLDEISHDEFVKIYKPYTFKNNFLPNQIGKIFWDYFIKYRNNQINEFENEKHGKNYDVLSESEFIKKHGEKPWELINEILDKFSSLQYEVNSPEGSDFFGQYQLKLKHNEKPGVEIDFNSLSSGEKILMALVATIYKASSDGHFPDVLLLDEIDASLHPSMMKNMLDVINDIFLEKGVKIIMISHSPTTIAIAPEESIYIMNTGGSERIVKKSKSEALAILTEGFATLEQGLKLFDQISATNITIITEGNNIDYIRKYLQDNNIDGIEILDGVEDITGKNQLRTLFDFFSKMPHNTKVLFVWDCDYTHALAEGNNTYPFSFPKNEQNTLAEKGIENLFSEELFDGYKRTITSSTGNVNEIFDGQRKSDFCEKILARNVPTDFTNFTPLKDEINRIKAI